MKKIFHLVAVAALVGLMSNASYATNIALNANVTLNGTFFTDDFGWSGGKASPASRIVNGTFAKEETQWNTDGVWWNGGEYRNNNIVINLNGKYTIDSFTVQADDNDTYRVLYMDSQGNWVDAYDVPYQPSYGLVTRPTLTLSTPIVTDALEFVATGGDGFYSVSQIEADGSPASNVPEPSTIVLLGLGLAGLVGRQFRRKSC